MVDLSRREIREIAPLIREAVRRRDFEGFKGILVSKLKVARGSDDFRSYEALFWKAIGERRIQQQL
jgi:hypothetical protein